jgi:DNA-binding MarR family transcriptional regulator
VAPKPTTPSTAEKNAWRSLMSVNHLLSEALERHMQRDAGMPHAYYTVMVFLYEATGRALTMSELAGQLQYSKSRLTHAVASMERSGWLQRSPSTIDRRVQRVTLTAEGLTLIRRIAPLQIAEVRTTVLSKLSGEQLDQLVAINEAILRGLEEIPTAQISTAQIPTAQVSKAQVPKAQVSTARIPT